MLLFSRNCAVDWDGIDLSELDENVQVGKRFAQDCEFATISQQGKTQDG